MEEAKISDVVAGEESLKETSELGESIRAERVEDSSELTKRSVDPEKISDGEENLEDEAIKEEETKVPLMKEDTVDIDIKLEGEDTPTLPMNKKNKGGELQKKKPPIYLFPITRMKIAWTSSSSICEFTFKASLIIFSTLGWMFCIGGVPFISIAMIIIGSIYIDDCRAQPNIPIYLIVSGVLGTVQHFIAVWTKYVPKESQGRLKVYRSYCRVIDMVLTLFLTIWFVLETPMGVHGENNEYLCF